jgi:hypothetical protein
VNSLGALANRPRRPKIRNSPGGRRRSQLISEKTHSIFFTPVERKVQNAAENMFSHVVIFWTDPAKPEAVDELLDGANKYLKPIPGVIHYHIGRMVPSHRPVVERSYQVGLNVMFDSKKAQDDYQVHPLHVDFIDKVFKRVCKKVVVYDFE